MNASSEKTSTRVITANNAVARKAAKALHELALQTREGEWLLQINFALTPASAAGSPGDDNQGQVAPQDDNQGQVAPNDDNQGQVAPNDDNQGQVAPGSEPSVTVHAPIELRGASITVRFATHAAKRTPAVAPQKTPRLTRGSRPARGQRK